MVGSDNSTVDDSKEEIAALEELGKWFGLVIIPLGVIANILTVIVLMKRKSICAQTTRIILSFLAITDSLVLITFALAIDFPYYWKLYDLFNARLTCRVVRYFNAVIVATSTWYLVLMTSERFIAVWLPLKASRICTKRSVTIACGAIPAVWLAFYGRSLRDPKVDESAPYDICKPYEPEDERLFMTVTQIITFYLATYLFVPCILILLLNTAIVVRIWQAYCRRMTLTLQIDRKQERAVRRSSLLVILASLTFLILMIPRASSAFLFGHLGYGNASWYRLDLSSYMLQYISHSINFFLYAMVNKRFRKELRRLVLREKQPKESHPVGSREFSSSNASKQVPSHSTLRSSPS